MASVDDIRQFETYLRWDPENEGVLLVVPHRRDWSRKNYQMDMRYIEWFFTTSKQTAVTVKADLSKMRIWHLDWTFLEILRRDLKTRIKNRVCKIRLCRSTIPVWFAHWCLKGGIPDNVRKKIVWE
tara:strand:- start:957 stop:1334 length:378 start_codon:yes stop_codon:yes gene_type:complete